MKDTFKTIEKASKRTLFKERGSKFFGYAFPVLSEDDIKNALESLKNKHPTAGHFCYAWQLGTETIQFRVNDNGEPKNSAGMPIYGQLQAFDVTNVLVVSVRYFGGTKLGVGGLAQAYKYSAQITLEASEIISKTIDVVYEIKFDYDLMNKVMRIIKDHDLKIVLQKLDLKCEYHIAVRKKSAQQVFENFEKLYKLIITKLE
ncbi:YigZ family protein [Flavobacteriaceae bacterium]|uniref:IMPACT family protein n=1 Tax=Candidatus Arcticimaribacter forsetii TaxID=2820661 RepID=UPI002076E523|nr:YigZ family protein [Candidatus Arcticimaribacter forsetii]MDA8699199.1 YigZ family protein [Flavobacteriaceae bacterium]MDB2329248.1 YigZ family protein [Flavobacteriaceae bacterium]MDB2346064.1 YigZ family protein [Flavobacteriaceae bacterium]MDB4621192.1 YigZ family protein [Flavobacteriaceae bacterium]MDB4675030.1 YigZ family protein [Flavobacteriaceae bacterium]